MEHIDLAFFGYIAVATLVTAITIVLVTNRGAWLPVVHRLVSNIMNGWQSSVEQARQQKARRERLYNYADMSSYMPSASAAEDSRTGAWGAAADAGDLRRGHTHQVNVESDTENAADQESFALRQLSRTELIVMLAAQRKEDGSYLWSSNDIKKFVPGADGLIGETISTVRGKRPVDPPTPARVERPSNGWKKA